MARKTKKELYEERIAARQADLERARLALIDAIGYEGEIHVRAREGLREALVVLEGAIRGSVDKGELRVALAPTNAGFAWPCDVFVPPTDLAAERIGAVVGYEVVDDVGWGKRWRRIDAAAEAVQAWERWVEGFARRYERAKDKLLNVLPNAEQMAFDDGDAYEEVAKCAIVLREARQVRGPLASAAETEDDLQAAEILRDLHDRCVQFLIHGSFVRNSSSAMSNLLAQFEGEMRGKVADMAGAVAESLAR